MGMPQVQQPNLLRTVKVRELVMQKAGLVHACYRPSDDEIAWAKRVMAAVALSKGSAVKLDGMMVDVPVIRKAEEILADLNVT